MTNYTRKYRWSVRQSYNPNKAWLVNEHGLEISALMSARTAKKICTDHNQIVEYLLEKASDTTTNPTHTMER